MLMFHVDANMKWLGIVLKCPPLWIVPYTVCVCVCVWLCVCVCIYIIYIYIYIYTYTHTHTHTVYGTNEAPGIPNMDKGIAIPVTE